LLAAFVARPSHGTLRAEFVYSILCGKVSSLCIILVLTNMAAMFCCVVPLLATDRSTTYIVLRVSEVCEACIT
jgi:hypothetical protein